MKNLLNSLSRVDQKKRAVIARSLIVVGILLAYSPYWVALFFNPSAEVKMADIIVSIGWWILTPGLVLYFLNIWLNYRADRASSKTSE